MVREKGSPITYQDRVLIEKLYKNTYYKDLEKHIGIPYQSIYRELKRCPKNRYTADAAQANVDKKWEEGKKKRQETMKRQSEKRQVKKSCYQMKRQMS